MASKPSPSMMEKLDAVLRDEANGAWVPLLAKAELATGQPRTHIAGGVLGALSLYLVVGFFAELVCNAVGMAYPAYASLKAIKSVQKDDDTTWLIYWTVFATFSLVDFASDAIMGWFPLYWLGKMAFLFWLWCPLTQGALILHRDYLAPALEKFGPMLAQWEAAARDKAKGL